MNDEFNKKFGKPIGVLLYAIAAFFAGRKKPLPLILLLAAHTGEYFLKARKIAADNGIDQLSALANTLSFGFAWWLPIKKDSQSVK